MKFPSSPLARHYAISTSTLQPVPLNTTCCGGLYCIFIQVLATKLYFLKFLFNHSIMNVKHVSIL